MLNIEFDTYSMLEALKYLLVCVKCAVSSHQLSTLITLLVILHTDDPPDAEPPRCHSIGHSSTPAARGSPTSAGVLPQPSKQGHLLWFATAT
jgi:hypothetical protein